MILLTILLFIVILGLLIFVHELGHFFLAKRSGMTVEEFGFGYPPRLWSFRWRGTLYSLNWIPFGGFVKILGENGESSDQGSFAAARPLNRFLVLIAGVTMNAILAWLLLSAVFAIGAPTLVSQGETLPKTARISDARVSVLYVEPGSPAETAGLRAGDVIESIAGQQVESVQDAQDFTGLRAGEPLAYGIARGEERFETRIIPRTDPPEGQGPLGVALGLVAQVAYPWYESLYRGLIGIGALAQQIVVVFWLLISNLFTENSIAGSLTGPIGIAVLTRDAMELGFVYVLQLTAVLSINLAVINALPFPALDGGRVLFLLIEQIRRRRISSRIENAFNSVGFLLLVALLFWISARDIMRIAGNFFK